VGSVARGNQALLPVGGLRAAVVPLARRPCWARFPRCGTLRRRTRITRGAPELGHAEAVLSVRCWDSSAASRAGCKVTRHPPARVCARLMSLPVRL